METQKTTWCRLAHKRKPEVVAEIGGMATVMSNETNNRRQ